VQALVSSGSSGFSGSGSSGFSSSGSSSRFVGGGIGDDVNGGATGDLSLWESPLYHRLQYHIANADVGTGVGGADRILIGDWRHIQHTRVRLYRLSCQRREREAVQAADHTVRAVRVATRRWWCRMARVVLSAHKR
jgi:hypothetical protein